MKILIPYRPYAIGGPITFLNAMSAALHRQGHTIATTFTLDFDRLLILDSCPLWYPLYAKVQGKKIIQRLDGVYYPALPWPHSHTYVLKNLGKQMIHNYLADHIIYQSEFSRRACRTMLGKPHGTWSVIYNGAPPARKTAASAAPGAGKTPGVLASTPGVKEVPGGSPAGGIKLVTHTSFRDPEQIVPLARAIKHLPQN